MRDGAFWLPPDAGRGDVVRLVALVVAPDLSRRSRCSPPCASAWTPPSCRGASLRVDSLPRDATGKLPAARLAELATRLLAESGHA